MEQTEYIFNSAEELVGFLAEQEGLFKHFPEWQIFIKVWNSAQKSCGGCGSQKGKRLELLEDMYENSMPDTPEKTKESIVKNIMPIVKKDRIVFKSKSSSNILLEVSNAN